MFEIFLYSGFIIFIYACLWFIVSLITKRNDIADIAWGLGYIILVIFYLFQYGYSNRSLLLFVLVILWGARLTIHIYLRNRNKTEDFRYKKWREDWGNWFYPRSFFQVYIVQGFLLIIIISGVTIANTNAQPPLNYRDLIGVLIWLIGFFFETVGDWQLKKFLENQQNKGKIMQSGLWKYTRHPNYFGEVTMWWGIFLIVLSSPFGWFGIVSPLTISFLILFVSGIPMLEKKYLGNTEFEKYKQKTSVFFPLPPKK